MFLFEEEGRSQQLDSGFVGWPVSLRVRRKSGEEKVVSPSIWGWGSCLRARVGSDSEKVVLLIIWGWMVGGRTRRMVDGGRGPSCVSLSSFPRGGVFNSCQLRLSIWYDLCCGKVSQVGLSQAGLVCQD